MPPVTALRSPPDSRITGADSPVTADSSTEAMPSITVPSPGISSPASTTTTSPRREFGRGLLAAVAQVRDGLGAHRAQGGGLGLPATLRQRLGEVGEHDRQPQPERHSEREPGGSSPPPSGGAAEHLDQPSERRDRPRRSRRRTSPGCGSGRAGRASQGSRAAPGTSTARSNRLCCAFRIRRSPGRAPGSARARSRRARRARRAPRPSVLSSTGSSTRSSGSPRTSATRRAWIRALRLRDVRVDAGGGRRDRVDRHVRSP